MLEPHTQEALALVSHKPRERENKGNDNPQTTKSNKSSNNDGLWCTYCNKLCHMRENCIKLHCKTQVLAQIG